MDFLGLTIDQWIDLGLSVLMVAAALVAGRWLLKLILDRLLGRLTQRTDTGFDDAVLTAVRPPLYWVLVLIVIKAAVARLDFLPMSWEKSLDDLFFVFDVMIGFVLFGRLMHYLMVWYGAEMAERTETNLDEQLLPFFRRVVLVFVALVGLIVLLGRFVNVSSLITTLGVGTLAIALAAQAALADTISGFLIMVDRPFRIGDRIEIQDLATWGDVVDIGLSSTRIRTRDNRTVIIPNSVISKSLVVNHSYPDKEYRIQVEIGVAYGTDVERARQTMIKAIRRAEGVVAERKVEALLLQFGDSALTFRLRWWIDSYVDTRRMFDRVNTAVYNALNEAGIEIPCPQMDVRYRKE
jgi:small-conductance mechanosensitive channel